VHPPAGHRPVGPPAAGTNLTPGAPPRAAEPDGPAFRAGPTGPDRLTGLPWIMTRYSSLFSPGSPGGQAARPRRGRIGVRTGLLRIRTGSSYFLALVGLPAGTPRTGPAELPGGAARPGRSFPRPRGEQVDLRGAQLQPVRRRGARGTGASKVPPCCTIWYNTLATRCYMAREHKASRVKALLPEVEAGNRVATDDQNRFKSCSAH
jgi:hypothetical protein